MVFKIQTCEKPCIQWSFVVPLVNRSIGSPYFMMEGESWCFSFHTTRKEGDNDVVWAVYFEQECARQMPSKFLLSAYVRDIRNRTNLFIAHKEITQFETEIWSINRALFFHFYPQFGNLLTFVFVFDYGIRNFKDIGCTEKVHKSVQTSSYLDDSHCLRNLSLDFSKLMDDSSNPDVHLTCGDCTIPAHRLVLSARSEVFRAMLQSDMVEGREGSVKIVDMEPKVFEIFIRYLYTGILPELTGDTASSLYEAGDKYNLQALMEKCGDFLAENLTRESVYEILTMADAHNDEDLKDRVVSYVLKEKIHDDDDEWTKFCDDHPKIGMEVFRRAYKKSKR